MYMNKHIHLHDLRMILPAHRFGVKVPPHPSKCWLSGCPSVHHLAGPTAGGRCNRGIMGI